MESTQESNHSVDIVCRSVFPPGVNAMGVGLFASRPDLRPVTLFVCIINGFLIPATVVANLLVFVAILRKPRLRTVLNTSILCLATTDLIIGLFAQPAFVVFQATKLQTSAKLREICIELLVATFLEIFCIGYSLLTLNLMTIERYLAVFHPFWYHDKITIKRVVFSIGVAWVLWTAIFLLFRFNLGINSRQELIFTSLIMATNLIVTAVVYFKIFKLARGSVGNCSNPEAPVKARERKATKTVTIVTGTVFFCFLPTSIAMFLDKTDIVDKTVLYHGVYPLGETVVFLNSFLNSMIYVWRSEDIRESVQEALGLQTRVNNSH